MYDTMQNMYPFDHMVFELHHSYQTVELSYQIFYSAFSMSFNEIVLNSLAFDETECSPAPYSFWQQECGSTDQ